MAKCYFHSDKEAVEKCVTCGKQMCESCTPRYANERVVCPLCSKEANKKEVKSYKLIALLISLGIVLALAVLTVLVMLIVKDGQENLYRNIGFGILVIAVLGLAIFMLFKTIDSLKYYNARYKLALNHKEVPTTTGAKEKKVEVKATTTAKKASKATATKATTTASSAKKPATAKAQTKPAAKTATKTADVKVAPATATKTVKSTAPKASTAKKPATTAKKATTTADKKPVAQAKKPVAPVKKATTTAKKEAKPVEKKATTTAKKATPVKKAAVKKSTAKK